MYPRLLEEDETASRFLACAVYVSSAATDAWTRTRRRNWLQALVTKAARLQRRWILAPASEILRIQYHLRVDTTREAYWLDSVDLFRIFRLTHRGDGGDRV